jgi:thiol-disulfide isomerase/thioredoxin
VKEAAERILKLDKEGKSEEAAFATRVLLQMRVMKLNEASADEQVKVFEDVRDYLAAKEKPEGVELGMAVRLAQALEVLGNPAAADAYETFGEMLTKNENEQVAEHGKIMLGMARRLKLVGNSMELSGDTVEGKAFDLADWKGKVVLVDFWATWCGPCVQEIPHVKEMYEKYHEKGFEVVGISLDADRPALESFLKEKSLPWTILHQNDGKGNHPAAVHYGIVAIPFMTLVDRDGKVVSIEARGEELTKLLEKQFAEDN